MIERDVMIERYRSLLDASAEPEQAINGIVKRLSADLSANVLVSDAKGLVVAYERTERFNPFKRNKGEALDAVLFDNFSDMHEDLINIPMDALPIRTTEKQRISDYYACVYRVDIFRRRAATVLVYRKSPLEADERIFCEGVGCFIGIIAGAQGNQDRLNEERKREMVRIAVDSLSYSELMVTAIIFKALDGNEGVIVASRIADAEKVTRSVIVNAIRKLEGAGIVQAHSLGMKGTYIKVVNEYFNEEIVKLKK